MTVINIPAPALVVLIGPSGSGKSTFARKHFKPTHILASDLFRGLVADDENAQGATDAAFEVLQLVAAKRLEASRLTVIDATNVQPEYRWQLIELARKHHCHAVAIVFDLPVLVCLERSRQRTDRTVPASVIRRQHGQMVRSLRFLSDEGFEDVHVFQSEEAVAAATVEHRRLIQHEPFDFGVDTR